MSSGNRLYLLDYGAGNVQSLANSLTALGYTYEWISTAEDFDKADKLIFPGVGAFSTAISNLAAKNLLEPLRAYVRSGRPYFGICIGMQVLFSSSTESPEQGLGIINTPIERFSEHDDKSGGRKAVPHMGWNHVSLASFSESSDETSARKRREEQETGVDESATYYFVHSYRAKFDPRSEKDGGNGDWAHTLTQYGQEVFLATVRRGNVFACQFHPEKSGKSGLRLLKAWLDAPIEDISSGPAKDRLVALERSPRQVDGFTKRIVACMDIRANDDGDLVVTKGDQYDVREKEDPNAPKATTVTTSTRAVRNLGKPVALALRYYTSGADEICLLNITSFRNSPLRDQPMLAVVREAAKAIYVPLTIGGGIKDTVDPDGTPRPALEVAGAYFRAGADKVSIGSEAVVAVERLRASGSQRGDGTSPMETISAVYGRQAVVVSVDPKRVFVDPSAASEVYDVDEVVHGSTAISAGLTEEERGQAWWYQCTIKGGRETRPLSVKHLVQGVELLGAGEVLLNSIDRDGTNRGFDLDLIKLVRSFVGIPVVASSGAGKAEDFSAVFEETGVEAALAAGIFHREEVRVQDVKDACARGGLAVRLDL